MVPLKSWGCLKNKGLFTRPCTFQSPAAAAAAAAKSLQSCPMLCDPIDGTPPGSPVPGILQARTLEWVAISFSNAWKWKVKGKSLSRVGLFVTPWTEAYQAPPPMGFSRQEYWSGLPLPSPQSGDRSLEFSRRRKGETFFFPLHSLVSVNYTTQFKLCTRDYTTVYLVGRTVSPSWKPSD